MHCIVVHVVPGYSLRSGYVCCGTCGTGIQSKVWLCIVVPVIPGYSLRSGYVLWYLWYRDTV